MHRTKLLHAALASALLLTTATAAQAADDFSYHFSGFGTLGYAATDSNQVAVVNPGQLKGAGNGGSVLPDSRVGAQVNLTFNANLGATAQVIAMQDAKGKFVPQLQMAFLSYNFGHGVVARLGRIGWPAYQVSDFRYVGYANPWVRAPLEVYSLAPMDYFDGADVRWTHDLAGGYFGLHLLAGHATRMLPESSKQSTHLKVSQLAGAYASFEKGGLTVRAGASTSYVNLDSTGANGLVSVLGQVGFSNLAAALDSHHVRTTFTSLGAKYDDHNILVMTEYGKLKSSAVVGSGTGWYGTFGYRFSNVMPYVTWAGYSRWYDVAQYNDIPAAGPLAPLAAGVAQATATSGQHSASAGVRWDFHSNVALKVQVDRVTPSSGVGALKSVAGVAYTGGAVNVYSAVVDFVF